MSRVDLVNIENYLCYELDAFEYAPDELCAVLIDDPTFSFYGHSLE